MCGGGPKVQQVAATDPAVERQKAANAAQRAANAETAASRRLRQQQSLLATGASSSSPGSILAQGKARLGV